MLLEEDGAQLGGPDPLYSIMTTERTNKDTFMSPSVLKAAFSRVRPPAALGGG